MSWYATTRGSFTVESEEKATEIVEDLHDRGWEQIEQEGDAIVIPHRCYRNLARVVEDIAHDDAVSGKATITSQDGCYSAYTIEVEPSDVPNESRVHMYEFNLVEWGEEACDMEFPEVNEETVRTLYGDEAFEQMDEEEIEDAREDIRIEEETQWVGEVEWMFHENM